MYSDSLFLSKSSEYVFAMPLIHVLEAGLVTTKTLFDSGIYLLNSQSKHIDLSNEQFVAQKFRYKLLQF